MVDDTVAPVTAFLLFFSYFFYLFIYLFWSFLYFCLTSACNRTFHLGLRKITFLILAVNLSLHSLPPSSTPSSICCCCFSIDTTTFFPTLTANSEKSIFQLAWFKNSGWCWAFTKHGALNTSGQPGCTLRKDLSSVTTPACASYIASATRVTMRGRPPPCSRCVVSYSLLSILPAGNSYQRPEYATVHKNKDKLCCCCYWWCAFSCLFVCFVLFHKPNQKTGWQRACFAFLFAHTHKIHCQTELDREKKKKKKHILYIV